MLLGIHLVLVDLFSSKHRNHGSFVFVLFVNPLREITGVARHIPNKRVQMFIRATRRT
jgi:hypothetical protein